MLWHIVLHIAWFTNYFLAYTLPDFHFSSHPEKAVESCIYRRVLYVKKLRFREVKQPVQGLHIDKWQSLTFLTVNIKHIHYYIL